MARSNIRMLTLALTLACVGGCTEGKHPFRMVQFCLKSQSEIPVFTSFMHGIATKHKMEFHDRSEDTQKELQSLALDNKSVPNNGRALNIGAHYGDEFGFGVGNLGMPADQVVIGFNGNDMQAARAFANSAVEQISEIWNVKEVAAGKGASPLKKCA